MCIVGELLSEHWLNFVICCTWHCNISNDHRRVYLHLGPGMFASDLSPCPYVLSCCSYQAGVIYRLSTIERFVLFISPVSAASVIVFVVLLLVLSFLLLIQLRLWPFSKLWTSILSSTCWYLGKASWTTPCLLWWRSTLICILSWNVQSSAAIFCSSILAFRESSGASATGVFAAIGHFLLMFLGSSAIGVVFALVSAWVHGRFSLFLLCC